jgi:nucleoside-diphosphate-sugar epimerase
VVAAGPPGAYNIAGDGPVSMIDIVRDLGFLAVPLPARQMREAARWVAGLRFLPSGAAWAEALSQPPVMDTAKARTQLGWTPRFTGREALQATLPGR